MTVRRFASIAKATTLEIASEPLSLLLLSASVVLSVFAPAFHYHQFGEPTRMARDAGLSALLIGGILFAVIGAVRTFRREFESGTAAVAMSHPVSRMQFFFAKAFGVYVAFAMFAIAVGSVSVSMVNGAAIGANVASKSGDIPKLWGPSYAFGVATVVIPYILGAFLNRFLRVRFALSGFLATLACAVASLFYRMDVHEFTRMLSAMALLWIPPAFFTIAASAASVRMKTSAAVAIVAVLLAGFVPFAGSYSLSEALSHGGSIPWHYVALAALCAFPAILAASVVGVAAMYSKDI